MNEQETKSYMMKLWAANNYDHGCIQKIVLCLPGIYAPPSKYYREELGNLIALFLNLDI